MQRHKLSVDILTIFPQMFPGTLQYSLAGHGLSENIWQYRTIDIKQFGLTKHRKIDDTPYGGGAGMVMRADVLASALDYTLESNATIHSNTKNFTEGSIAKKPLIIYMSPRGERFTQQLAMDIISQQNLIILCGRFEGIDERVIDAYNIKEISIGDYILSGGELAAMVLLDSCIRLLPDIIKNELTLKEESFGQFGSAQSTDQLLEYPLYTRPGNWRGRSVPEILLSGNHQAINTWRHLEASKITRQRRPDLLKSSITVE